MRMLPPLRGCAWTLFAVAFLCVAALASPARADEAGLAALKSGGHVLIVRHALTLPGVGDPRGFRLEDCGTQRNLNDEGREESRTLGRLLRERGVKVDRLISSEWCRAIETAELMGLGAVEKDAALNDLYGRPQNRGAQVDALRKLISAWKGPGTLLLVSHGSVTGALLQINPEPAEGVVLAPAPDAEEGYRIVGRAGPEG